MMASIGAAAEPAKISNSIYGFYLGESKQAVIQRAKAEGIVYTPKGKIASEIFPESYVFEGSLNKSGQVKYAIVSFYKDYVGQVNIYLVDSSEKQYMQAAQGLEQSWNSFAGFSDQTFGPSYIITLPDVLITLVKAKDDTHIAYIHRGMMRTFNEERSKILAKKQS